MVDITLDVSSSETGEKVILDFEYDETLIEKIKDELPVQETNYGYHRCDDEESPLYEYYDKDVWFVDRSVESLSAVEETLGFSIPSDFWPEAKSSGENTENTEPVSDGMKITVQNDFSAFTFATSTDVTSELREVLDKYGEEKSDLTYSLPIGLYQDVVEYCNECTGELDITWPDVEETACLDSNWKYDGVITASERRVVDEILDAKIGYVRVPRNAERTMIVSRFMFEVNRSVLIVTPTIERAENWCAFLTENIDVETTREYEVKEGSENSNPSRVVCMSISELHEEINSGIDECDIEVTVFDDVHQLNDAACALEDIHTWISSEYRVGIAPTVVDAEDIERNGVKEVIGSEITTMRFSDVVTEKDIGNPVFERVKTPNVVTSDLKVTNVFDEGRLRNVLDHVDTVVANDNDILVLAGDTVEAYLLAAGVKMDNGVTTYRNKITQNNKNRKQKLMQTKSVLRDTEITDSISVCPNENADKETIDESRVVISTNKSSDVDVTFDAVLITHDCELSLRDVDRLSNLLTRKQNEKRKIIDVIPENEEYSINTRKREVLITEFFEVNDSDIKEIQSRITQHVQGENRVEKAT